MIARGRRRQYVGIVNLVNLPKDKQTLLSRVTSLLSQTRNLAALALGGSYASGRQTTHSDLDLGLYYRESSPYSTDDIAGVARALSANTPPIVTEFYKWGPWVNGGAWIHTPGGKVDFLYRNIDQVERTIENAQQGRIEHHYGQQPPHGFYSVIYLAETAVAIPLFDPNGEIRQLKQRIDPYPEALRHRVLDQALWSAEFTLQAAYSAATACDVYTTVGCITRISADLTQALFALNREYFLTDKRLASILATFDLLPPDYVGTMNRILGNPGEDSKRLTASVNDLHGLWKGIIALTNGMYRSHYPPALP